MRNTRERLAKGLVEKGVLTSQKTDFFLFNMTTHPVTDPATKQRIVRKLQSAVLDRWTNDVAKMDVRTLALVLLANASDVLENAFDALNDNDHELAWKRVHSILNLNCEAEAAKSGLEVLWAAMGQTS